MMAIYNIFDEVEKEEELEAESQPSSRKDRLFSTIGARLFFFFLFLLDLLWGVYAVALLSLSALLSLLTLRKQAHVQRFFASAYLRMKRSLVCALALFVTLFSPALGVMFACTYFMMYDKEAIDEIVPSVIRDQFKAFMS